MEALSEETVSFFTDNLLNELISDQHEDNLVLSPIGLVTILAMTLAGASGSTLTQLAQVINISEKDEDELHRTINSMINLMDGNGKSRSFDKPFTGYNVSVRSLALTAPPISSHYVDLVHRMYNSKVEEFDTSNSNYKKILKERVNDWVNKSTSGRIDSILQEIPPPLTRLVLINAVSFAGEWEKPFNKTSKKTFFNKGHDQVEVEMMTSVQFANFTTVDDVKIVEIPYRGSASMIIMLPESQSVNQLLRRNVSEIIKRFDEQKESTTVRLTMPPFKTSCSLDLLDKLASLGARDISTSSADLSRMTGGADAGLYLDTFLHKTQVDVNENGTLAHSSSVASFALRSYIPVSEEMTVDRPFAFFIRDEVTRIILFAGKTVSV